MIEKRSVNISFNPLRFNDNLNSIYFEVFFQAYYDILFNKVIKTILNKPIIFSYLSQHINDKKNLYNQFPNLHAHITNREKKKICLS